MKQTFVKENKLHAIIRCLLYWGSITACFTGINALMAALPAPWSAYGSILAAIGITFFITWLFCKFEKRSLKSIGLVWERATITRFIKGLGIGLAIFVVMFFTLVAIGKLQFTSSASLLSWSAVPAFLHILIGAFGEELMFRSYPLVILHRGIGLWGSQVIVAIAFALLHVMGEWSVYSAFMGPGIWAFVFGLAAVWSGGIAMPTGIHVALNVLQVLTGMKGSEHALLVLSGGGVHMEQLGFVLHLVVLAVALILTWMKNKIPATS